jgi:hypothetical protein
MPLVCLNASNEHMGNGDVPLQIRQVCRLRIHGAVHMRPSASFLHLGLRLVAP